MFGVIAAEIRERTIARTRTYHFRGFVWQMITGEIVLYAISTVTHRPVQGYGVYAVVAFAAFCFRLARIQILASLHQDPFATTANIE